MNDHAILCLLALKPDGKNTVADEEKILLTLPRTLSWVFTCLQYKSFESTMGKGEIAHNFSFSHSIFYPFGELFCHFHWIQNCLLQTLSVWRSLLFVVWERVNQHFLLPPQWFLSFQRLSDYLRATIILSCYKWLQLIWTVLKLHTWYCSINIKVATHKKMTIFTEVNYILQPGSRQFSLPPMTTAPWPFPPPNRVRVRVRFGFKDSFWKYCGKWRNCL